jgi:hypothetical protein
MSKKPPTLTIAKKAKDELSLESEIRVIALGYMIHATSNLNHLSDQIASKIKEMKPILIQPIKYGEIKHDGSGEYLNCSYQGYKNERAFGFGLQLLEGKPILVIGDRRDHGCISYYVNLEPILDQGIDCIKNQK